MGIFSILRLLYALKKLKDKIGPFIKIYEVVRSIVKFFSQYKRGK